MDFAKNLFKELCNPAKNKLKIKGKKRISVMACVSLMLALEV